MSKKKQIIGTVEEGLRHIAFADCSDAVRLLLHSEDFTQRQISSLDLYNVASLKRTGSVISEIKFYDRIKALEALESLEKASDGTENGFIDALRSACEMLNEQDEDEQ